MNPRPLAATAPMLVLAATLLAGGWLVTGVGCNRQAAGPPPADGSGASLPPGEVRMWFDFGDGREVAMVLESVHPGTTVESLMRRVSDLQVEISGSGTTAMVQSIDGHGTTGGKGWLYQVDGRWADRGIGQTTVDPGSELRWRYGRFDTATDGDGAGS